MVDEWYVLQVLTGKELDIKSCIHQKGFISLVPRRKLKEQKNGIWKVVERLLLPGYVFIKADMQEAETYYKVIDLPGVIDILRGAASSPTPITKEEMQQSIFRYSMDDDLVGISDIFIDGDKIVVQAGPLLGLEGQIVKVDKRRFRAKVKFSLAGHEKTIELGVNVISKIV